MLFQLKKMLLFGCILGLAAMLGGCGGGGGTASASSGTGGSTGTTSAVTSTPGQTGLWVMAATYEAASLFGLHAGSTNLSQYYSSFNGTQSLNCSSGSGQVTGTGSTSSFSISETLHDCVATPPSGTTPFTSSGSINIGVSSISYSTPTCAGLQMPDTFTLKYELSNYLLSQSNPTEQISGDGMLTAAETAPSTCDSGILSIPLTVTIPSADPFTGQLLLTIPTAAGGQISASVTDLTLNETILFQVGSAGVVSATVTINSGQFVVNGTPYTISTKIPLTYTSGSGTSGLSGGVLSVTGGNESDTFTFLGAGQVQIARTVNGATTTTPSEPLQTYLGL
ncbi:MAG: hypothetical protein M0Z84_08250 [Gammaproteobacteria bacterium]|nr:hypothetical protein [Gammaproteobacteria bacterium]